jgi:hypothetical protein
MIPPEFALDLVAETFPTSASGGDDWPCRVTNRLLARTGVAGCLGSAPQVELHKDGFVFQGVEPDRTQWRVPTAAGPLARVLSRFRSPREVGVKGEPVEKRYAAKDLAEKVQSNDVFHFYYGQACERCFVWKRRGALLLAHGRLDLLPVPSDLSGGDVRGIDATLSPEAWEPLSPLERVTFETDAERFALAAGQRRESGQYSYQLGKPGNAAQMHPQLVIVHAHLHLALEQVEAWVEAYLDFP